MRTTTASIIKMKRNGEKIPMLTAYDYPTAKLLDELGIPMILVGDSLGMVVLGYESTVFVTMETWSTTPRPWPGAPNTPSSSPIYPS